MLPTRIIRITLLALTVAWCCSVALAQDAAPAAAKKRVAVMNFDYGTVRSYVSSIFGSDQDVGKGISDLLVQKLVQDGRYSVIERNALDKILSEQNFSNSDRADAATAAKIGKVLGVDAIIIGSITQFGRDDQHTNVGGGGYGLGKFGLGGVGTSKAKAVVGISARMVNTSTGEILVEAGQEAEVARSTWAAATSPTRFSVKPCTRPWTTPELNLMGRWTKFQRSNWK